ncbi:pirin family protein [Chitinophaga sp.]|uniref:pirin family protein n=1 Tax=Chitinophaga sp. TaxID=1869181 RepID=UPI002F923BCB
MAQYILHKADSRGHDHAEWLDSKKTFSFADYYNPKRMGFGALRVLNDDTVAGGKGFGSHPHDNMEIISIPLEGSLLHEDNVGNKKVVTAGQVQIMSTGSGVFHSEYNYSDSLPAKFLQIWVYPEALNTAPGYTQIVLPDALRSNQLYAFIKPDSDAATTTIRKDTWFSIGTFDKGTQVNYPVHKSGNGVYAFVIAGSFTIDGRELQPRDGLGVWDTDSLTIGALSDQAELLLMEVPMTTNK